MPIIGLVGPFGSGCSYVGHIILENDLGYYYISLSKILREEYKKVHPEETGEIKRSALQDFGDDLRESKGNDYLSKVAYEEYTSLKDEHKDIAIDSIRNPDEVNYFKDRIVDFFVIGIFAEKEIRWERVKDVYHEDQAAFNKDEQRDKGEKVLYGQRVTDAFLTSDAIVLNNDAIIRKNDAYQALKNKIDKYLKLFNAATSQDLAKDPSKAPSKAPSEVESIMTMAYSNSLRSSCLKRKVGAVIVDEKGNVFSSGYNEVPFLEKPCLSAFGGCYRSVRQGEIERFFNEDQIDLKKAVMGKVKLLEKCRALHAEENAILNVARFGSATALKNATLFTTTYPCNLCANKIAQVGIKKVVYYEPYPVEEAKVILEKAGIIQEMFEGITFNAYFRIFNEIIP